MEGIVEMPSGGEGVAVCDEILCALAGALAACVRLATGDLRNTSVHRRPHRLNELVVEIVERPLEWRQTKRHLEGLEVPYRSLIPAIVEQPEGEVQKRGKMAPQEFCALLPKPWAPLVELQVDRFERPEEARETAGLGRRRRYPGGEILRVSPIAAEALPGNGACLRWRWCAPYEQVALAGRGHDGDRPTTVYIAGRRRAEHPAVRELGPAVGLTAIAAEGVDEIRPAALDHLGNTVAIHVGDPWARQELHVVHLARVRGQEFARARIPGRHAVVAIALIAGCLEIDQLAKTTRRRDVLREAIAIDIAEGAAAERREERGVARSSGEWNLWEPTVREIYGEDARGVLPLGIAAQQRVAILVEEHDRADRAKDRDRKVSRSVEIGDGRRPWGPPLHRRQEAWREQRDCNRPARSEGTARVEVAVVLDHVDPPGRVER